MINFYNNLIKFYRRGVKRLSLIHYILDNYRSPEVILYE